MYPKLGRTRRCLLVLFLSSACLSSPAQVLNSRHNLATAPSALQAQPKEISPVTPGPPVFPGPRPLPPIVFGFSALTQSAGMIFSGTVISITRTPADHEQSIASVAITFHVDQAIRGVIPGEPLTVHEWAGLWTGVPRYRVGEKLLLFFYPPSKLGLTSPVAGFLGRFTVDSIGRILLSPVHRQAFQADLAADGRSFVTFNDLVGAVQRAGGEEWVR